MSNDKVSKWDGRLIKTQKETIDKLEMALKLKDEEILILKEKIKIHEREFSKEKLENIVKQNIDLSNEISKLTKIIGGFNSE